MLGGPFALTDVIAVGQPTGEDRKMADQEPRDEGSRSERPRNADDRPRGGAGSRPPSSKREGKPYVKREGAPRDADRKPYVKRDGDKKPSTPRDGERKSYPPRDGERKSYPPRDGERKFPKRDGDRSFQPRDGAQRGGPRPTRGGADRPDRATRPEEIRPVRARHDDPVIPDDVTPQDLNGAARNELKTLSKENAEGVARHLAMAARLIDDDPALAHEHAVSASRRAGRIAVVRETLAITAYAIGDFALALRELRTFRRISGRDDQIALMVDSERGVGRPDRALEVGRSVDRASLPVDVRVQLAIAMSGARLDLDQPERALQELDIPEFDPDRAFEWTPSLFAARAGVLEELGRMDEASLWQARAIIAADALDSANGIDDLETVIVEEIEEEYLPGSDDGATFAGGSDESVEPDDEADPEGAEDLDAPSDVVVPQVEADATDHRDGADDVTAGTTERAPSVEDEVAEILIEAGVDEADEGRDD
ncbi:hypothetical protein QL996_06830 [Planococcus sp. APC 4015]|nr:hypothetical protein [Planococcus sp. APC 4015]